MLETRATKFPEALVIAPDVFYDERGYFKETYSQKKYEALAISDAFVQDNVSFSGKGVLRGMHYDFRMAKLVQCLEGVIYDAIVDMREESPTYKQWDALELSSDNHLQLYVPPGFAHGFYVLSDYAVVLYKQTAPYDRRYEQAVSWRDKSIGIEWPLEGREPVLSAKDAML
jgi:dTDP-4-dehydrorhamnose 3,5-epimerase